jgi:2-polyprenyl-3-methyl-5-hydroxy-6-metoxy-1,4-benzoquinol methylase
MIKVTCNLCGRDEPRVRFPATTENGSDPAVDAFRCTHPGYGQHLQIVECRHCGLVYASPRWPSGTTLAAYEAVEDTTYVEERAGRELTFRHHLRDMEKIVGPAGGRELLDVGAYIGVFVEVVRAAGWQAMGVEPSAWAAAEARKRGLEVLDGTLASAALADRRYDVITLWDVIEHFDDPSAELRHAYDRLRPGGWLVAHTMDIDAPVARLMGSRWPWLMDMHLTYFSRRTLAAMLEKTGFEVVRQGAQGRYLRMGYLATRVGGLSAGAGRAAEKLVGVLGLEGAAVPVNFGDLITIYGRRSP